MNYIYALLTALLFLMVTALSAQEAVLSEAERAEDVHVFSETLLGVHPGLDIYRQQAEIDSLLQALENQTTSIDLSGFYRLLLNTITQIDDGHTDLLSGKRYAEVYPYFRQLLPLQVEIIEDDIYITQVYAKEVVIPQYARILSVNGFSAPQILDVLYAHTPSDGGNIGFKACYNTAVFSQQFAKLITYGDTYHLQYLVPGEDAVKTVELPAMNEEQMKSQDFDEIPLAFELNPSENYAKLTVNTFQYLLMQRAGIDFHDFIEESFAAIRKEKVENLIIDLRNNYGGDNILAITLYSYLTQGSFQAMAPSYTKLDNKVSVSSYSNYPNGKFRFLQTHDVNPLANGWYELSNGIDSKSSYDSDYIYRAGRKKPQQITRNKFSGKVYCLISGMTFSAASNFASLLSREKRAIFVGSETGGASGSFCGGGFYTVTLPNSRFRLQVPFMKRRVAGIEQHDGIGVQPDFVIVEDLEMIMAGEDQACLQVLKLINAARVNSPEH